MDVSNLWPADFAVVMKGMSSDGLMQLLCRLPSCSTHCYGRVPGGVKVAVLAQRSRI